jgi:phytol kinase
MTAEFTLNLVTKLFFIYLVAYGSGLLVKHKDVKVNYTRKINHFIVFFIPLFIDQYFPYNKNSFLLIFIGFTVGMVPFIFYTEKFRNRFSFFAICFSSFDRPEDRPHTLLWLSTQVAAGFLIIVPMYILLQKVGKESLIFIPIIINGIGDGLAEPVGIRFGKHKYETYALFSKRKYVRSFEGSACVFVTSIIAILIYHAHLTPIQLVVSLCLIPILMTLAEAFSPHTWDTPFLFLVGYLSIFGISFCP